MRTLRNKLVEKTEEDLIKAHLRGEAWAKHELTALGVGDMQHSHSPVGEW